MQLHGLEKGRCSGNVNIGGYTILLIFITYSQDSGVNPLSSTTVLNIIVLDVTDPPPSFTLSQYAFSVTESQSNVRRESPRNTQSLIKEVI